MKAETLGAVSVILAVTLMIAICLVACCGCEPVPMNQQPGQPTYQQMPSESSCPDGRCPYTGPQMRKASTLLDLPPELRTMNYGGGSCMHAAIQDVLKQHGMFDAAEEWRKKYRGAFSVDEAADLMDRLGFDYAFTVSGDVDFLEWCSRNGHGAAIHYYSRHAITFRGFENGYAILQNNNSPDELIRIEKSKFIKDWKAYGGRAITVVASPNAPTPHL